MKRIGILIALFFSVAQFSQAMVVHQTKGNKALVDLEGTQVQVGQQLLVLDANNKRIGRLKITNVGKGKALTLIEQGKAPEKSKLSLVVQQTPASPEASTEKNKKAAVAKQPEGPRPPYLASVLLGLAANTLSIKVGDGITSQDVDNTGNSIGVALAVDRQYFRPWFRARVLAAYEQFNAIGAASIKGCANQTSKDCTTDIKYLSVGGYGKFVYDYSQFQFWGAAGLNMKIPITKSSTALVESSLGPTVSYGLTAGADYNLESKNFLTVSLEKQFYIKSDSAETSTVFVRLGVGKEF